MSVEARASATLGDHTAVILAGGAARRLGGVRKPLLSVGGESLLAAAVGAARAAGCKDVVVVGPPDPSVSGVRWMREEPPGGGPVAALLTAVPTATTPWVLTLAADIPRIRDAVALLSARRLAEGEGGVRDGVVMVDARGRRQMLLGRYRTDALRRSAAVIGNPAGVSMRRLLEDWRMQEVHDPDGLSDDVDTWEDVWTARTGRTAPDGGTMSTGSPRTLPPDALDAWTAALAERLGIEADDVPIALILDLARDVAHGVARPAAPLSAFVAGLVAGRAGGSPEDVATTVAAVADLARTWRGDAAPETVSPGA